jgi:hypothetical protein
MEVEIATHQARQCRWRDSVSQRYTELRDSAEVYVNGHLSLLDLLDLLKDFVIDFVNDDIADDTHEGMHRVDLASNVFMRILNAYEPVPKTLLRWAFENMSCLGFRATSRLVEMLDDVPRGLLDARALSRHSDFVRALWMLTAEQIANARQISSFVYDMYDECGKNELFLSTELSVNAISAISCLKYLVNTEKDLRIGNITESDVPHQVLVVLRGSGWDPDYLRESTYEWLVNTNRKRDM